MNSENYRTLPVLVAAALLALFIGLATGLPFEFEDSSLAEEQLALVANIEKNALRRWQQRKFIQQDLALGSQGEEVWLVQKALSADPVLAFAPKATGFFGGKTAEAVRRFQKEYSISETGSVDAITRAKINEIYFRELCPSPGREYLDLTFTKIGPAVSLPEGYTPPDLVDISGRAHTIGVACLRKEAAVFLEWMIQDAAKESLYLAVVSGFRQEAIQDLIYRTWVGIMGKNAESEVAKQGHSEHQLGTAVDLTGASINYAATAKRFGESAEGKWLGKNAYRYGFVMSYPAGKEDITGYAYEPWHWRYVGATAGILHQQGITFAEFAAK